MRTEKTKKTTTVTMPNLIPEDREAKKRPTNGLVSSSSSSFRDSISSFVGLYLNMNVGALRLQGEQNIIIC